MSVLPCASVPADLGRFPDHWRVNYAFGMVMGVDDFRQEQAYHVGRQRLHARGLHGYGVAYGLDVLYKELAATRDLEIRVRPGLALMPGGEDVEVEEEHCLLLNEWLAERTAEELAAARLESGELRLCVTLRHLECLERPVPVPGLPCASDGEETKPSRIREAFELRLEPLPIDQNEELANRRFGDILCRVEIDQASGVDSDEDAIVDLVRAIPRDLAAGAPLGTEPLRIPKDTARDAVQRIYRTWASEVRPELNTHKEDPANAENRIILSCLTFEVTVDDPPLYVPGSMAEDDSPRPVLIGTRTLQELFFAGARSWGRHPVRFATLHAEEPDRVLVWIHHAEPLQLTPAAIRVQVNGTPVSVIDVDPMGTNTFALRLHHDLNDDDRIQVSFTIAGIRLADGTSLLQSMDDLGIDYVSRTGPVIYAETILAGLTASRSFVSFKYLAPRSLELWFHTPNPLAFPGDISNDIPRFERDGIQVPTGQFTMQPLTGGGQAAHQWRLDLDPSLPTFREREHLTFTFDTRHIRRDQASGPQLRTWINETETRFVGWDGERLIDAFHQLSILQPVESSRPTRRFARLCPLGPRTLRMWLSPPFDLSMVGGFGGDSGPLTILVDGRRVDEYRVRLVDEIDQVYDVDFGTAVPPMTRHLARTEVHFHTPRIGLASDARTLADVLPLLPYSYLDQRKEEIWAYHLHCCCEVRTCHFASVLTPTRERGLVWFHTDEPVRLEGVRIDRRGGEFDGEDFLPLAPVQGVDGFSKLFEMKFERPLSPGERLSLHFPVEEISYGTPEITVLDHTIRDRVKYVCWDGEKHIRVFHGTWVPPRVPPPLEEEPGLTTDKVVEIARRELDGRLELYEETGLPAAFERYYAETARPEMVTVVDERTREALTAWVDSEIGRSRIETAVTKTLAAPTGATAVRAAVSEHLTSPEGSAAVESTVIESLGSPTAREALKAPVTEYLSSATGMAAVGGRVDEYVRSGPGSAFIRGQVERYMDTEAGAATVSSRVDRVLTSERAVKASSAALTEYLTGTDEGRAVLKELLRTEG